ncbi:MAG: ABC transporter permease [Planctomycetota bacterium]
MADTSTGRRLTSLSIQVVAVWGLRCVFVPIALLVPIRIHTLRSAPELTGGLIAVATVFTLLSIAAGAAYALRVRIAWYLLQACLLVGVFLGGYYSNPWVFVGEAVLMIYLYFSLYTKEVREEFDVHAAPREVGVLLVLLAICVALTLLRPRFLEGGNLLDLARQFSMVGVMAVGMTMVIILGGIDLSVGSVVAISGCLATMAYSAGSGLGAAVLVALAVGGVSGAFNGGLISRFRMAPFIITLGTMSMARSLTNVVTGGEPVVLAPELEESLKGIAWADTCGVPNPVWVMAIVVLVGHVFMTRTRTGRHIYYIGSNEEAARLSGLNVTRVKWLVYIICGVLAGLAGIIQAARVASGQPGAGRGDELRVIAAVIIGGASFTGGEGTVLGAVLGAAIMGVLRQGLVLLEVETFWQKFVEGGVIIGAVALDMIRRSRAKH